MSASVVAFFAKADLLGMDFTEAVRAACYIERAEIAFGNPEIWAAVNSAASGEKEPIRAFGVDIGAPYMTGDPSKDGQEAIRRVVKALEKV